MSFSTQLTMPMGSPYVFQIHHKIHVNDGFFEESNACLPCSDHCIECSSANVCTQCEVSLVTGLSDCMTRTYPALTKESSSQG